MKLELTRGYFTEVDEEDFEWANQWSWCADVDKRRERAKVYAIRRSSIKGKDVTYRLGREITLRAGFVLDGKQVDHRNRDTLDNRRDNLRVATRAQNCQNRLTAGYHYCKRQHNWKAEVSCEGVRYYLGRFETEQEAADAVASKRKLLHGEFSCV